MGREILPLSRYCPLYFPRPFCYFVSHFFRSGWVEWDTVRKDGWRSLEFIDSNSLTILYHWVPLKISLRQRKTLIVGVGRPWDFNQVAFKDRVHPFLNIFLNIFFHIFFLTSSLSFGKRQALQISADEAYLLERRLRSRVARTRARKRRCEILPKP